MEIPEPSGYRTSLPRKSISSSPRSTKPMWPFSHHCCSTNSDENSASRICFCPSRNTLTRTPGMDVSHGNESNSALYGCIAQSLADQRRCRITLFWSPCSSRCLSNEGDLISKAPFVLQLAAIGLKLFPPSQPLFMGHQTEIFMATWSFHQARPTRSLLASRSLRTLVVRFLRRTINSLEVH